ncbi:hypothetical protein RF11_10508 [Thelohanellus kitauei]|uniref:Uncharacterized protein n=1 Tax=Thelohanellus kitauei TaxID=669202 RepID=A0A0C2IZM9_THEKT|nr:hypothetical protein RF11_10508 [Thelohanellus kitauei]
MKTLALSTAARSFQIIFGTLKDSTSDLSAIILDAPTLNATIQRISKLTSFPYIFHTNPRFDLPNEYKNTMKIEERFLFSDTFTESATVLIIEAGYLWVPSYSGPVDHCGTLNMDTSHVVVLALVTRL